MKKYIYRTIPIGGLVTLISFVYVPLVHAQGLCEYPLSSLLAFIAQLLGVSPCFLAATPFGQWLLLILQILGIA